jgi:hypothetical protein
VHREADLLRGLTNDFDDDAGCGGDTLCVVRRIGEDPLDEGEAGSRCLEERPGAIAVLNGGGMGVEHERTSIGIDKCMALAAFDLLTSVVAAGTAGFRGLDALTIEHARARTGLAPNALAVEHQQVMIDRLQKSIVSQSDEPAVDRASRWEMPWQHAPGTARTKNIEDRVHELAQRPCARATRRGCRRKQRLQHIPLRVGHVASIAQVLTAMLQPGGRGPHEVVQIGLDNRLESHLAPAIQPFFQVSRQPLTISSSDGTASRRGITK